MKTVVLTKDDLTPHALTLGIWDELTDDDTTVTEVEVRVIRTERS